MVTMRESMLKAPAESPKNRLSIFFDKYILLKMGWQLLIGCLCIAVLIFFAVISWRIAWSNLNVDLSKFEFSDLLALIMGLFAIAMSVAFYFKATDTSNKFYDNVYKFTQETSEILGRIEAGFGERLRHLDEGYTGLQTRFDSFSSITPAEGKKKVEETKEKETEEKAKLEKAKQEMESELKKLTHKAYSQERERHEFMEKIGSLQAEKDMAEDNLRKLKEERDRLHHEMRLIERDMFQDSIENESLFREIFRHPEFRHLFFEMERAPFEIIRNRFIDFMRMFPREISMELQKQGILAEHGELTKAGYIALRNVARRLRHNS